MSATVVESVVVVAQGSATHGPGCQQSARSGETLQSWCAYIGVSKAPDFICALEAWLDHRDPDVRAMVLATIVLNDSALANQVLLRVVSQETAPNLRRQALRGLVRRGSLDKWEPIDLAELTVEKDWTPHTKREYLKLFER